MGDAHVGVSEAERGDLDSIWVRARTQAFAHQAAVDRLGGRIKIIKFTEITVAILGLGFLVLGYSIVLLPPGSFENIKLLREIPFKEYSTISLFVSTMTSVVALYITMLSNRDKMISERARHGIQHRLFMNVSNKTRARVVDIYDDGYYKFLIAFLNGMIEAFQTAGESPTDKDYQVAHWLLYKTLSERPEIVESFAPDAVRLNEIKKRGAYDPRRPFLNLLLRLWKRFATGRAMGGGSAN